MELIKKLSGHSGCNLNLYKKNEKFLLRKDAGTISYNYRLKKQCVKQKIFKQDKIKTPAVLEYGYDKNGIFYFDMEFINGIAMSEYMYHIKIKEIEDLISLLMTSLQIKKSHVEATTNNLFQNKIVSLKYLEKGDNLIRKEALNKLKGYDFSNIPISACCGDLTLENIILSTSGVYVIDLLDSFCNSWMIDVAKILQDIDLKWSYRHQDQNYNLNLRLATAKNILLNHIQSMENGAENIIAIYHILLLNVLRIYPYTKDEETFKFLDNALRKVLTTIKEKENRK